MKPTIRCVLPLLCLLGELAAARVVAGERPTPPPLPPLPTPQQVAEKEFRVEIGEGVVIDFKLIPAGTFVMDSPPTELGRSGDEAPRTRVELTRPYYMSKTEITQLQYDLLMPEDPSDPLGGNYPVNNVTWDEAMEFCKRLTDRERAAGRLAKDEAYRLPTEAEWERACRAGTDTRFSFGGVDAELVDHGWCIVNSAEKPHVVALKQPSPWGLYDMHGNVWEWCLDWYAPQHPGGKASDPAGPRKGVTRVLRGGSWAEPPSKCRSASRSSTAPKYTSPMIGFRIVRTISEKPSQ